MGGSVSKYAQKTKTRFCLGTKPGRASLFGVVLPVASREIERDAIASNMTHGILRRNVLASLANIPEKTRVKKNLRSSRQPTLQVQLRGALPLLWE